MRSLSRMMIVSLVLCVVASASLKAKEEKVSLDQVPQKVVKAESAKWPTATIKGIEREEENGKTLYEFGLLDGKRKLDVSFSADGALVAVEEVIDAKDVPAPVVKALEKKHPRPNVLLVEKVMEGEGDAVKVFYEYKIKTTDGGLELKFDSAGKLVGEEQKKGDEINE